MIEVTFQKLTPEEAHVGVGVVFRFPSQSRAGREHTTIYHLDGEYGGDVTCSCEGFQFTGSCWHQDMIQARFVSDA